MTLLGSAAVAMWWSIDSERRTEFEDWHSHEHFPERLRIPGFLRGSRWACAEGGDGFFVIYELQAYETLTSPAYLARLNDPTPWSTKMMPFHRGMVRSQCRVLESFGGGLAGSVLTLRLSPAPQRAGALRSRLQQVLQRIPERPGATGAHLLQTQTPAAAVTTEQLIRGGADNAADWIVLVGGYDAEVLRDIAANELGTAALGDAGALAAPVTALYRLSFSVTSNDV